MHMYSCLSIYLSIYLSECLSVPPSIYITMTKRTRTNRLYIILKFIVHVCTLNVVFVSMLEAYNLIFACCMLSFVNFCAKVLVSLFAIYLLTMDISIFIKGL